MIKIIWFSGKFQFGRWGKFIKWQPNPKEDSKPWYRCIYLYDRWLHVFYL